VRAGGSRPAEDVRENVGDVMSRAARRLQDEHGDIEATLEVITSLAATTVPNVEDCSISYVVGRRRVEPRAATSELPAKLDALQSQIQQGPCLDAVWEHEVVRVDDVAHEPRWPRFAVRAAELGVGSMLCFPLFVTGEQLGAMNLYSRTPHALDEESELVARMLAAHAAIALAGAQHEVHLRLGMDSRDVLGQAKGILMERHKITGDQAFGVLVRASQELNRKVVEVARELSETGVLPDGQ